MATGGIRSDHSQGVQAFQQPTKGEQTGKLQGAEHVSRGFSGNNTISHADRPRSAAFAPSRERVRLPTPKVDPAKIATPELQAQLSQTFDTTEVLFNVDSLLNELGAEEREEAASEGGDSKGSSVLGQARRGKTQSGDQGGSQRDGRQLNQSAQENGPAPLEGKAKDIAGMQIQALDIFDRVIAIKSAPPEVLEELKVSAGKLQEAVLTGNVEDMALMMMEVQTKLQNTRIKFDEQAIQATKLKRAQSHEMRLTKLQEALDKMKEAKTTGILGKVFSAIATVLALVVAAVTIATGVGAKAGIALIMACMIMVALTISQNTGNWMTNMGGLIKNDKVELALGLAWAIIAAALSMGAGLLGGAKKATTDVATTTVQQTANATGQAAQQAATAASQAAQQGANAAQQVVQQGAMAAKAAAKTTAKAASDVADDIAQETVKATAKATKEAAKEAAKTAADTAEDAAREAAKTVADGAEDAAKQATKTIADSADDAVKDAAKSAADAAKEGADDAVKNAAKSAADTAKDNVDDVSQKTAEQMAKNTQREMAFRRATHIGRFMQGGSMAVDGAATMHGARVSYEGEIYGADARELFAEMTGHQLNLEDLMESIERTFGEIKEGHKQASDMLAQAHQSQLTIARNI